MKTFTKWIAAFAMMSSVLAIAGPAEAKCFGFRDNNIRVCIEGHNNAARNQATRVCEDVTGSDCRISGDSGSTCQRSSNIRCYDADGDEQRRIELDD